MTTEILLVDNIDIDAPPVEALTIYKDKSPALNITDTEIQVWKDELRNIQINGVKDSKGYNAVENLRKKAKKKRIEIDNYTEDVKSILNGFKKRLMTENDRVGGLLLEIETDALSKTDVIDKEKERIKEEEKKKQLELLNTRRGILEQYNYPINEELLKKISQPEFESLVASAKMLFDANKIYLDSLEKTKQENQQKLQQEIDALQLQKEKLEKQTAALQSIVPQPAEEPAIEKFPWDSTPQTPGTEISLFENAAEPAQNDNDLPEENANTEDNEEPADDETQLSETDLASDEYKLAFVVSAIEDIKLPTMREPVNILLMTGIELQLTEMVNILKGRIATA